MDHLLAPGSSIYTEKLEDDLAIYFTKDYFELKADGIGDDTDSLQKAINQAHMKSHNSVLFIPEGKYRISRTIYIPRAMRLIGYGKNRPIFILGKNTKGFHKPISENDKGQANYMFWFVDQLPKEGDPMVIDSNPGTFYSALTNVNIRIEDGNSYAVALRTHFAQHCFVSHVDIHIGSGKAGLFDVGNEIEDVRFFGGDYGIYTTKPSPGWPFMMIDTIFKGQRKAAILTKEAGLTILRMKVMNVPIVIETALDSIEKLYMEDCQFEQIGEAGLIISNENNVHNQINLKEIRCKDVPVLASFRQSGRKIKGNGKCFLVKSLTHGNQIDDLGENEAIQTIVDIEPRQTFPKPVLKDIPDLPLLKSWINIKHFGAKGDGLTDDTLVIQRAIHQHKTIYFPQGVYTVSETIQLKEDTTLIGLNPLTTIIKLPDHTKAFSGLGSPKPLLEVPQSGRNIVFGLGIDAGARNPRVVGCKWMAGHHSYMNDVKFIGGHGNLNSNGDHPPVYNSNRTGDVNPDLKWDSQYWSLWITLGGGIFKDIWTASPYAEAGLYVSDTTTMGKIYAMSVEHHVRHEVKFKNVSNWKIYALQFEEEVAESSYCQPLEIASCSHLLFANLYFFRVIWMLTSYPYAIKIWDVKDITFYNIHNFSQIKQTINNTLLDVTTGLEVRPWELARLTISGKKDKILVTSEEQIEQLGTGFDFADAICRDSKGNIYFVDSRWKQIYKWSADSDQLGPLVDVHYKPLLVACDTMDHLIVVVEYFPPKGTTHDAEAEVFEQPFDSEGTSHSYWYKVGSTIKVYSLDTSDPDNSLQELRSVKMGSIPNIHKVLYPGNRWRDSGDYLDVTVRRPEVCYVAPDGITILPVTYDLMRAVSLIEAFPGTPFYGVDEYSKRTVKFNVSEEGYVSNAEVFIEKGEYNLTVDDDGNIIIADGDLYKYNPEGRLIEVIRMPERPACIVYGGRDGKSLYVTTRGSFYRVGVTS